jgi:hypothetical protein
MQSNFPNGFKNGVTIRGIPVLQTHPGAVFWVSNAATKTTGQHPGSNGNRGSFDDPFATLDYAIGKCVANRGDIIFVKPGHAETVSSATALNFDIAGVAIVGLGVGSKRPLLTFDTANTATIPVSADDFSVQNIRFVGNFLSIASVFTVAAAANFAIEKCEFTDTSAILGFLSVVTTTVAVTSDNLYFADNRRVSIATTSPGPDLVVLNTMSGLTIENNRTTHLVANNNVAALLNHAALVMTDLRIVGNYVYSVNTDTATGGVLVVTTAITGSGMIAHNRIRALDIAAEILVTATAIQYGMFDNLYIGDGTYNSGFVSPAIGTTA